MSIQMMHQQNPCGYMLVWYFKALQSLSRPLGDLTGSHKSPQRREFTLPITSLGSSLPVAGGWVSIFLNEDAFYN